MTVTLRKGRYQARMADGPADIAAAQGLRHLCFVERAGLAVRPGRLEHDRFDAVCHHLLIEDAQTGDLAGCCRLLVLESGSEIDASYSAQSYDLDRLKCYRGRMLELGRFCVHPAASNADVLRVAWGALTKFVDRLEVKMLFGCSSFPGTDPVDHRNAFDRLAERHLGPAEWQPGIKAKQVVRFGPRPAGQAPAKRVGVPSLPPLLRTYLVMGGWVSDHAVVDPEMNTLHVFTGLEVGAIPEARAQALRALAG
ncbi:GNAT family N-acetyltransferase [Flavimaricola marinus]|uniref:L-ornithine N(alpha)-acyltransferase n=1 Tax=Flavimaricola marinus TaxID=1819565 RepID=A0A238LJB3_9RHOB|nr:GNAT family N-acyltransferase [Flavimaricola marinus]SMY09633.1 hypothetical protein LOM8899_03804 [Flavimaricola marinus]